MYNAFFDKSLQAATSEGLPQRMGLTQRILRSRWMPFSILTDDEYEAKLRDKQLRIRVEIELVNERIERVEKDLEGQMPSRIVQPMSKNEGVTS